MGSSVQDLLPVQRAPSDGHSLEHKLAHHDKELSGLPMMHSPSCGNQRTLKTLKAQRSEVLLSASYHYHVVSISSNMRQASRALSTTCLGSHSLAESSVPQVVGLKHLQHEQRMTTLNLLGA